MNPRRFICPCLSVGGSLRLHARRLDDRPPFFDFRLVESAECLRGTDRNADDQCRVRGQPHDGRTGGVCCSWNLSEGRPIIAVRPPEGRRSKGRNAAARPSRPRRASLRLRHWRRLVLALLRSTVLHGQLAHLAGGHRRVSERWRLRRCQDVRRGVAGYRRANRLLALPMLRDEEGREQERAKHHINQGDCV